MTVPTIESPVAAPVLRKVQLTPASTIKIRPVRWLWKDRIPLGCLALVAGREGIGKSTLSYQLAADVTTGLLPGQYAATRKSVIVAATEDSWEHTIVPRLMAAGADLERVYRVDVVDAAGNDTGLVLPRDLQQVEQAIHEHNVGLVLLDPLMSRLDGKLDTHKDSEVRMALEPLTALADRSGASVIGLIHVNKGFSADPLTMIMGSRAFTAVARAVLFVMTDPENADLRLLGTEKNNLGRTDLPTLMFRIVGMKVADTMEGPVYTGRVDWAGESERSIREALEGGGEHAEARSAWQEAGDWLFDYLTTQGGEADSRAIKDAGRKVGHSEDTLKKARGRRKFQVASYGMPRRTKWVLPTVGDTAGETT